MTVLPEEWSVLEGSTCPPPPVDRSVLRATWVVVRGKKMQSQQQSTNLSRASEYARLKNALSELRKIRLSGTEYFTPWSIWKQRHETLVKQHGLMVDSYSVLDSIREMKRLLSAYIVAMEAEMGIKPKEGKKK